MHRNKFRNLLLLGFFSFVQFSLAQALDLSGYVVSSDSSRLQGAFVQLVGTTLNEETNSEGYFSINRIKPGQYTLRISLLGFETVEQQIQISESSINQRFILQATNMDLGEVVVTSTKSEKQIKNAAVVTQVINARQMLQLGINNVAEALQRCVPGIDFAQFGTQSKINMQGLNGKYVLFLIDGERIAGDVDGDIDYSRLTLDNVDRIEVIKGASSAFYGSNAIGGVINIITKRISGPLSLKAYTRYASHNTFFGGFGASFKKGIIGSAFSANYNKTDGYDLTPETSHEWTQSPYSNYTINQKFEIAPTSNFLISPFASFYNFERKNKTTRPVHDLYRDFTYGVKSKLFLDQKSLDFSYINDFYRTYSILERLNNQRLLVASDNLQTGRIQANVPFADIHNITLGIEDNYEKLFTGRISDSTKTANEGVFFAQDDVKLSENLSLIAGFRASTHSQYGFHASPKLSMMYKLNALSFRASVGTGFRSPSLKEIYMYFDHFGDWYIIGNTNLKPESSRYLSGSIEFNKSYNNTNLSLYRNNLTNMIGYRWTDSLQKTRQYVNISKVEIWGFDILSKQQIYKSLWLSGGYNFVHTYDAQTGLQVYGTTKHSGNVALDYTFTKHNYQANMQVYCKINGRKFYELNTDQIDEDRPYTTWKLSLSQKYKYVTLTLGVDNILDVKHPESLDFISSGRTYFAGLIVDFDKFFRF